MTFFLIILIPYILILLMISSLKSSDLFKNLIRAVLLFETFLVLNLFFLKKLIGIDLTFVNHRINPDFLSLKAIVFSCVFALILGNLTKVMTDHFALIFKKGVANEE